MSLTTKTDVTAVKFFGNFILSGIGSFVNIYDKENLKPLQRIQGLNGQKIYGFVISKCGDRILVFGGKQFSVLTVEDAKAGVVGRLLDPVLCDDWMHSALWVDKDTIALLTAHNVVQKWSISNRCLLSEHKSSDNSILYSGLLLPAQDDLIVLAGTVFSEVIIHRCGGDNALHNLKGHRGVIFSICCDPEKEIIVTTSDDRSVRIWTIKNPERYPCNTLQFWEKITIECSHEVYGHTARVMRCFITENLIVSGGEDAAICYWDLEGSLIRKVAYHQTSTVWSIDGTKDQLVTGGGDGGIVLHPLSVALEYCKKEMLDIETPPKLVAFTARNNIVILNEDHKLIYYDMALKSQMVYKLNHKSTYKMLTVSSCKQIIAVADMRGCLSVFVENCKSTAYLQDIIDTKLNIETLMSIHWAGNRHLVLCTAGGEITVLASKGNTTEEYAKFVLPEYKERYLTAATIDPTKNMFICGDRYGNVHCYLKGKQNPLKTFKRSQCRYGPTSITVRNNVIVTTGRHGSIVYSSLEENIVKSKFLSEKNLDFQWVEKFLDKDENLVCGFQERTFIVFDLKKNARVLEVGCGGGHRAWDAVRYFEKVNDKFEEFIRFTYVKNTNVYLVTFQLSKIVSKIIVNGSQSKNINCLQHYISHLDSSTIFYISGGEDTTMRISSVNADYELQDEVTYKHLSNIKTLKTYSTKDNQLLVISAGGRAQICINLFKFEIFDGRVKIKCEELVDFMLRGNDFERKKIRMCRDDKDIDFDPETRLMDLDSIRLNQDRFLVFVGCSDAFLRIYTLDISLKDVQFRPIFETDHHKVCILKTICMKFQDKDLVLTCTTRGEVGFWNVINDEKELDVNPFENSLRAHDSGINSIDYRVLPNTILLATGGDDNCIALHLLEIITNDSSGRKLSLKIVDYKQMINHSSQINGLVLLDDVMISASIDQRVTAYKWAVCADKIQCSFLKQAHSDVADIQGLNILDYSRASVTVCVFGRGFEVLKIDLGEENKNI